MVGVEVMDGVINCGTNVDEAALVREGTGEIVLEGVQVASRGMMVGVDVSV